MKKTIISILLLAVLGLIVYKLFFTDKKQEGGAAPEKDKPLAVSKNSNVFNESFEKLLNSYFLLKQGLVEYDTAGADAGARAMAADADSLKISELKGDTTGAIAAVAGSSVQTIGSSARELAGAADLEKKKRAFKMISESLYDLARIVKYDRMKLFHQHCPMAFNDTEEATWLSNSNEVVNPYLGSKHPKYKNKMLHCGDITDSLDFVQH